MRIIILIITIFFSTLCLSQTTGKVDNKVHGIQIPKDTLTKYDSLNTPVITIKEFGDYLEQIHIVVQKQFDQTNQSAAKYQTILREMQMVFDNANKKRKQK